MNVETENRIQPDAEKLGCLRGIIRQAVQRSLDNPEIMAMITEFEENLKRDDPEAEQYLLFQILAGQDPETNAPVKAFDFPDHRIEWFIRNRLEKFVK